MLLKLRNTPKNARCVNCLLYYAHQELLDNINNWRAATAGTTDASTTSGNASGSVCPKGWTLPSGKYSNDNFGKLIATYGITDDSTGSAKLRRAPLSFNYTGDYDYSSGSLSFISSDGHYWSHSGYSDAWANSLRFSSSKVKSYDPYPRGYGYALRCVAR